MFLSKSLKNICSFCHIASGMLYLKKVFRNIRVAGMKCLIFFILIAGLFQSLQCSLSQRIVFFSLDSDVVRKQHARVKAKADQGFMVTQLQMSQACLALTEELQNLKMKTKPENEAFLIFCLKISEYKQKYLDLLQWNKLLYDEGHDRRDNHFNSGLLVQLQEIAKIHSFETREIPSPVY